MKTDVTQYDFERAFADMGRGDSFTYAGKQALYDWLIEYEEGTGEEQELDVIALCCDFSEHDSALEAAKEYGFEVDGPWFGAHRLVAMISEIEDIEDSDDDELRAIVDDIIEEYQDAPDEEEYLEEQEEAAVEWLNERTSVIVFDGGVIIQGF